MVDKLDLPPTLHTLHNSIILLPQQLKLPSISADPLLAIQLLRATALELHKLLIKARGQRLDTQSRAAFDLLLEAQVVDYFSGTNSLHLARDFDGRAAFWGRAVGGSHRGFDGVFFGLVVFIFTKGGVVEYFLGVLLIGGEELTKSLEGLACCLGRG